jgi:hypothetical protein
MFSNTVFRSKWAFALSAAVVTVIIALTYWPVAHAGFIYDDVLDFQKMAWLRHGNEWQQFLLRRFNDWLYYFRPLGVALFTFEVRVFDVKPGSMHLVSLLIHLVNTLLVGALAAQLSQRNLNSDEALWIFAVPMLIYGLHPVLVEPVVWIGCQFELAVTLFMLLGWIANIGVRHSIIRAFSVAICFFLAACSKESAIAFPFILVVFDWFVCSVPQGVGILSRARVLLVRNWVTYVAILMAGSGYLALRYWALGAFIPSNGSQPLPLWAGFQQASFLFLRYWRMFFWPTIGMGPMHPVSTEQFLSFDASHALQDIGAACLFVFGAWSFLRLRYVGGLILCVTFALFPVLHIVGATFDASLYHERYAMTGLTMMCAWLPATLLEIPSFRELMRRALLIGPLILAVWLIMAIATIRVTVPLWSNEVKLWQWALKENPGYVGAKDLLISAYVEQGSYASAWRLIEEVEQSGERCVNCTLNAAILSIRASDPQRASFFLEKLRDFPELYASPSSYRTYLTLISQTELLNGHLEQAESAARSASALDRLDPAPQLVLAAALALQDKTAEATQIENGAISLLTPQEQPAQREKFKELLKSRHPRQ